MAKVMTLEESRPPAPANILTAIAPGSATAAIQSIR
jgi:hypothetical protein